MKQMNFRKPFDPENHVKLLVHRVICLCLLEKRHFDHALEEVFRFDKTVNASMREAAFLLSRKILRDLLYLKIIATHPIFVSGLVVEKGSEREW